MPPEERIFIQNGRRHYRKRYSHTEVRLGAAVVAALGVIAGWIVYRGAHPDPALFKTVIPVGEPSQATERGPLPRELALSGWEERSLSMFDTSNLYEKINGREGYYKAFGFRFLYFASLQNGSNPETAVDIELYDLGRSENAIGAFAGEMPEDVDVTANERGLSYRTPNALFMARGPVYLRALGSSAESAIQAALDHLQTRFDRAVEAATLPWAYALFVGQRGAAVRDVAYEPENAFSFGFATEVFTARRDADMQLFVRRTENRRAAEKLAREFREGFAGIGEVVRGPRGIELAQDRYLGAFSTAAALGALVTGVHSAPDAKTAVSELDALQTAARTLGLDAAAPPRASSGEGEPAAEGEQETETAHEETY